MPAAPDIAGDALGDYDYALPDGAIALRPAVPRDAARLLVSRPDDAPRDAVVRDLPSFLAPGDLLVVNDSRVIPARLDGTRLRGETAARVEFTLLVEEEPGLWQAFAKPAKRIAAGDVLRFGADGVEGVVVDREGPTVRVRFAGDPLTSGSMPLPPYIAAKRTPDARDDADYQTVYAQPPGSVAAPTAGLHFTPELLAALAARGVGLARVTLHVGAGTFLPVKVERLEEHRMHAESGIVSPEAVEAVRATKAAGGRVVAVGTTALRLLESAAEDERSQASGAPRPSPPRSRARLSSQPRTNQTTRTIARTAKRVQRRRSRSGKPVLSAGGGGGGGVAGADGRVSIAVPPPSLARRRKSGAVAPMPRMARSQIRARSTRARRSRRPMP